jgi:hypothetical protein
MSLIHVPLSVLPRNAPLHVTPECLPADHGTSNDIFVLVATAGGLNVM